MIRIFKYSKLLFSQGLTQFSPQLQVHFGCCYSTGVNDLLSKNIRVLLRLLLEYTCIQFHVQFHG